MIDINNSEHKVNASFNIEPELYIYLQKKARDDNISLDDVLNKIIMEYALNNLTTVQYIPYKQGETYTKPTYLTITISNNQTDLFKYFERDEYNGIK